MSLSPIRNPIAAIDFDHTIHDKDNPKPGFRMGPPMEGAREAITELKIRGYTIVIFCYWADSPKNIGTIQNWLIYFGISFDQVTNIKPDADLFIDNRAVRFTDWNKTMELINDLESHA